MKRLILSAALVLWAAWPAPAQESAELKVRFKQRLAALNELRAAGVVGENNKGFLEFQGSVRRGEDVVRAENEDRRKLYAAIAAGTGVTSDLVGQRRALQIAREAPPGVLIQDAQGAWRKKP